jgi:hypothetical protein
MDVRTDRLGILLEQFAASRDIAKARMKGLTDEEYLWEPAPGGWSIRRRGEARGSMAIGGGDWVMDAERPEPDPPPVTSIAWRLGHLYAGFSLRWEWTFGGREKMWDSVEFTPIASEAQERFWALLDRWHDSVAAMTDEQLDMVGFGQFPFGLDPQLPFISIVWWSNRELTMHTSEIALLRDLWRARA